MENNAHNRHRGLLREFDGKRPKVDPSAFIAETAAVIGDVEIGARSSIWFGAVLRGDVHSIRIGEETSIQDNTVVHVTEHRHATHVGSRVTVGHNVTLHGCTVGDLCIVGMGAVILDRAELGDRCIVGASALVTPGTKIPAGFLAVGSPARATRPLREEELAWLSDSARHYVHLLTRYAT
jgi:carbonic anhydrase/acetyltransferase-like protein (isoleucine patch superfamily)